MKKSIIKIMERNKNCGQIEGELLAFNPIIDIPYESFKQIAFAITKLGYRKQSDTIQEFMQKFHNAISIPNRTDGKHIINQIIYVLRNIAQEYLKEEKNE